MKIYRVKVKGGRKLLADNSAAAVKTGEVSRMQGMGTDYPEGRFFKLNFHDPEGRTIVLEIEAKELKAIEFALAKFKMETPFRPALTLNV